MGYHINLREISLDQWREMLETRLLIPSREILREDIQATFDHIRKQGICHLKDLSDVLKTKEKLVAFSKATGISETYLTLMKREINSHLSKPAKFQDFSILSEATILALHQLGINHTKQLYDLILTPDSREKFARETSLNQTEVSTLTKLVDLTRIRWVNHTFAIVLLRSGYDTAQKVASAHPEELHQRIIELNKAENLYKGHIGLRDIKMTIESAQDVPADIVF